MRLIIEIENEMDLVKVQSLMSEQNIHLLNKVKDKKRTRKNFAQWCRNNSIPISDFPSRKERNER